MPNKNLPAEKHGNHQPDSKHPNFHKQTARVCFAIHFLDPQIPVIRRRDRHPSSWHSSVSVVVDHCVGQAPALTPRWEAPAIREKPGWNLEGLKGSMWRVTHLQWYFLDGGVEWEVNSSIKKTFLEVRFPLFWEVNLSIGSLSKNSSWGVKVIHLKAVIIKVIPFQSQERILNILIFLGFWVELSFFSASF